MARGAYIGVGGTAKKIKKIYFGVGGVAKKVKKAYIGVGGVAKLFWAAPVTVVAGTNLTDALINGNANDRYYGCNLSDGRGLIYLNPGTSSTTRKGHWTVLSADGSALKIDAQPLTDVSGFTDCYQDVRIKNTIYHYWENNDASIVFKVDAYNESFTKTGQPISTNNASNTNPGYFSLAQTEDRVYLFGGYYSSARYRGSSKARVLNASGTEETAITGLSYASSRYYGTSVSFGNFVLSTGAGAGYCTINNSGTVATASFSSAGWTSMRAEDSGYAMSAAPYNDFGAIKGAVFRWNDYTNYNRLSRTAYISKELTQTIIAEDANGFGRGAAAAWIEGAVIFAGGGRSYDEGDCTNTVEVYNEKMTRIYSTPLSKAATGMGTCYAPVNNSIVFAQGMGPNYGASGTADKTLYVYRGIVE